MRVRECASMTVWDDDKATIKTTSMQCQTCHTGLENTYTEKYNAERKVKCQKKYPEKSTKKIF